MGKLRAHRKSEATQLLIRVSNDCCFQTLRIDKEGHVSGACDVHGSPGEAGVMAELPGKS